MFKLQHLSAINFRSYKTLELNDVDKLGLTLIHGKNGSGKSSIRLLLEYILTDSTIEKIPLDEIPFNGDKDCRLQGIFEDEIGNEIIITKYRNDGKHKNNTYLSVGKADLSHSDRRETQKIINQVFKLGENTLGTSTIFSQLSESFPQSKDSLRKKILYDALDLHKYASYAKNASRFIVSYKGGIDTINSNITSTQSSIDTLASLLDGKKLLRLDKVEVFKRIKNILILKRKELNDKRESTFGLIEEKSNLKSDLDSYKDSIDTKVSIESDIKMYNSLFKENESKKELLIIELRKHKNDLENWKSKSDEFEGEHHILLGKYNEIKNLISLADKAVCPIIKTQCKLIEEANYDDLIKEENDLSEKLEERKSILEQLINEIGRIQKESEQLEKGIAEIDKSNYYNKSKLSIKSEELVKVSNKIDNYIRKYGIDLKLWIEDRLMKINNELEKVRYIQPILDKLDLKINYLNSLIKELNEISKINFRIKNKSVELGRLNQELKDIKDKIRYYEFWKIGFSSTGIPNMKSEKFLYDLQNETNKNLSVISDELYVNIDSQTMLKSEEMREKTSYNVLSRTDESIKTFWSRSGGERQRVTVANILAFNSLLSKFNFILFDEALELSLDESGKDSIINLLKQKAKDIDAVIIISNDYTIKNKFDHTLSAIKEDGISKLV